MEEQNALMIVNALGGIDVVQNNSNLIKMAMAASAIADHDGIDIALKWINDNIGNPFI